MEKSGCAWIVGGVLAVVITAGLWTGNCGRSSEPTPEDFAKSLPPTVLVGAAKINALDIQNAVDKRMAMSQIELMDPLSEVQSSFQALNELIDRAALLEFAAKEGISLTDAGIIETYKRRMKLSREFMRQQLIDQKKIKPEATEAEFIAAAKKEGNDIEAQEKQLFEQIELALKDPEKRPEVAEDAAQIALQEKYSAKTKVSDADLEKTYIAYVYKELPFADGADKAANKKLADKVLAEIRAGKTFEQQMELYVKTPAAAGKKKSDQTQELPASLVDTNEVYKDLRGMKPGEVKLVEMTYGPVLYKYIEQKKNLPADFAAKKENYRKQEQLAKAFKDVMDDVDKFKKTIKIDWKTQGHKTLYDYMTRLREGKLNGLSFAAMKQEVQPILEAASGAMEETPDSRRVAILTRYAILDQLWKNAKTEAEKSQILEDRIQAALEALEETESPSARLELANIFIEKKDPQAVEQVLKAAEANTSLGPMGQKVDNDVMLALAKLKSANLGSPDDLGRIQSEHQRWLKEKQEEMAAQAAARLEEEKMRKEAEEEAKKNQPPTPTPKEKEATKPPPPPKTGEKPLGGGQNK
ncbi:MAG TPA: hypothetical protein PLL78_10875 [Fimbriimonadaceae bacterium]|nr:hypothetical protein [Fimbriimonadaceae bacterium]HRJ97179.1 hypothetical protein [Fimbriimonadaceae bacterium]